MAPLPASLSSARTRAPVGATECRSSGEPKARDTDRGHRDTTRPERTRARPLHFAVSTAIPTMQVSPPAHGPGWVDGEAPVPAFRPVVSSPPPAEPDLRLVTASGSP